MTELKFSFNLSEENNYSELFVTVSFSDMISVVVEHVFTVHEIFRTYTDACACSFEIAIDSFNYDSFVTEFDDACREVSADLISEKEVSRMYFGILKEITSLRMSK